jgi:hypothetical protein
MPDELQKPEYSDLAEIVRSAESRRTDDLVGWLRTLAKKPTVPGTTAETPFPGGVAPAR